MRKTTLLWASVCLLLSGAFRPLDAAPEREDEENADGTGPVPPAAGLVHQFCAYRADPGPCKALLPKFFFNVFSGQWEAFMYGGCRGNQNRVESQEACRERCIAGRPDFCFLDADMGPCGLYFKNYFYNHRSGRCEQFMYGGCQGNLNNFQSEAACQHFCGDPDDSTQPATSSTPGPAKMNAGVLGRPDFCFLDADMGPCRLYFRNYFYNHRTGRCEQFVYGGCQGNLNNFQSEAACQHFCGDPDDSAQPTASSTPSPAKRNAGVPGRPGYCFLDADMGPCGLYFKNYFYNHRSGRCEQFVYGGCDGNLNNFESEAACQHFCGDPDDSAQATASSTPGPAKRNAGFRGRPDYCFLDAVMGPCRLYFRNYFYNHRSGRCEQFVYGGCQGNLNNFQTEATCQHFCGDPDDRAQPTAFSTPRPAKRNAAVCRRPVYCFLEAEMGPCRSYFKNYFYNHRSRRCEEFVYGGCQGNLNNFETERDCQRSCGDPDDSPQPTASSTPGRAKRKAAVWAAGAAALKPEEAATSFLWQMFGIRGQDCSTAQ